MNEQVKKAGGFIGGVLSVSAILGLIFMIFGPVNALENQVNGNTATIEHNKELGVERDKALQSGINDHKAGNKELAGLLNQLIRQLR